jgi:hypothetical protein
VKWAEPHEAQSGNGCRTPQSSISLRKNARPSTPPGVVSRAPHHRRRMQRCAPSRRPKVAVTQPPGMQWHGGFGFDPFSLCFCSLCRQFQRRQMAGGMYIPGTANDPTNIAVTSMTPNMTFDRCHPIVGVMGKNGQTVEFSACPV